MVRTNSGLRVCCQGNIARCGKHPSGRAPLLLFLRFGQPGSDSNPLSRPAPRAQVQLIKVYPKHLSTAFRMSDRLVSATSGGTQHAPMLQRASAHAAAGGLHHSAQPVHRRCNDLDECTIRAPGRQLMRPTARAPVPQCGKQCLRAVSTHYTKLREKNRLILTLFRRACAKPWSNVMTLPPQAALPPLALLPPSSWASDSRSSPP